LANKEGNQMRKTIILTMALASQILAGGGFYFQLGNPEANAEARQANAVVTFKTVGCANPTTAAVTATAIGEIQGERRTIPLEVVKLKEPGSYALAQQWPKQGKWVIQLVGRQSGLVTSALVAAGPDGVDRLHARFNMKAFTPSEIEEILR
jgi:hypothetical protein